MPFVSSLPVLLFHHSSDPLGERAVRAVKLYTGETLGHSEERLENQVSDDKAIGSLVWTVRDMATNKVVSEGETRVRLQDVEIEVMPHKAPPKGAIPFDFGALSRDPLIRKKIVVDVPFHVKIAHGLSPSREVVGFALCGGREGESVFSWDWFNVDEPGHATKIQEKGELGIEVAKVGGNWEVVKTEFLTDVSLRLMRFNFTMIIMQPKWRIDIAEGSVVHWPSLVDGEKVANGFV